MFLSVRNLDRFGIPFGHFQPGCDLDLGNRRGQIACKDGQALTGHRATLADAAGRSKDKLKEATAGRITVESVRGFRSPFLGESYSMLRQRSNIKGHYTDSVSEVSDGITEVTVKQKAC